MERRLADLLPVETGSPEATRDLGVKLSRLLGAGDIIALYGDLGAGKTELVRGICSGLGIDERDVNSPTFTIVHEYRSGSVPVFHFDAYRIRRIDEFYDLGYEDYFFGNGVSIIEWADKVEVLVPEEAMRIAIDHLAENRRRVRIRNHE